MVTVLTGGAALFALALAGVLAALRVRTAGLALAVLAGVLAVAFVAFALIGERRVDRCLDRIPPLRASLEDQLAAAKCNAGETLGLHDPFR